MRNGNHLKSRVSEIHVKQICVNQGVGVLCCSSDPQEFFQVCLLFELFRK